MSSRSPDATTAAAFASSWNRAGGGSSYTRAQFLDWLAPIDPAELAHGSVLELGFGNGSLLYHFAPTLPARLCGVELGDTLDTARRNLRHIPAAVLELHRGDLLRADVGQFDLVYCIGVLHHLTDPAAGFEAVLRHVRPGGRFHCWVYAYEGNAVVRTLVDPMRRVTSRLPWWLTKYGVALPTVVPYYLYAKTITALGLTRAAPLGDYSRWISQRGFDFFHHVAFDQLVSPQTTYVRRTTIDRWLAHRAIDPASCYVEFRNRNSWKFGGRTLA